MPVKEITDCMGYQQITSVSSAVGLTPPSGALKAVIVAENTQCRWRDDGVNPTASVGMPLAPGAFFGYDGDLNRIKFIEVVAGAKLNVSYYR